MQKRHGPKDLEHDQGFCGPEKAAALSFIHETRNEKASNIRTLAEWSSARRPSTPKEKGQIES